MEILSNRNRPVSDTSHRASNLEAGRDLNIRSLEDEVMAQ